eukprot:Skav202271  [mRNA]  locus=scaffold1687:300599:308335:- [translate_table: standard]
MVMFITTLLAGAVDRAMVPLMCITTRPAGAVDRAMAPPTCITVVATAGVMEPLFITAAAGDERAAISGKSPGDSSVLKLLQVKAAAGDTEDTATADRSSDEALLSDEAKEDGASGFTTTLPVGVVDPAVAILITTLQVRAVDPAVVPRMCITTHPAGAVDRVVEPQWCITTTAAGDERVAISGKSPGDPSVLKLLQVKAAAGETEDTATADSSSDEALLSDEAKEDEDPARGAGNDVQVTAVNRLLLALGYVCVTFGADAADASSVSAEQHCPDEDAVDPSVLKLLQVKAAAADTEDTATADRSSDEALLSDEAKEEEDAARGAGSGDVQEWVHYNPPGWRGGPGRGYVHYNPPGWRGGWGHGYTYVHHNPPGWRGGWGHGTTVVHHRGRYGWGGRTTVYHRRGWR